MSGSPKKLIDADRCWAEMVKFIEQSADQLTTRVGTTEIYTISIWTDPQGPLSSISADTFSNSKRMVDEAIAFFEGREMPIEGGAYTRNTNAADFEFRDVARLKHESIVTFDGFYHAADANSEELSQHESDAFTIWERRVFAELEPILIRARDYCIALLRTRLRLHPDARIAVNSIRDWYDHEAPLH